MLKLEKFFDEKELGYEAWTLEDDEGTTHHLSNEVVIEAILNTGRNEQSRIYHKIAELDFANADINDYLKHLAKGLIRN